MKQRKEKSGFSLTFSVSRFFGIHLLITLLALQMFLTAEVMSFGEDQRWLAQSNSVASHSPFPVTESPPSPSFGPVDPSPDVCETAEV